MDEFFQNPTVRFVSRALLAGLAVFLSVIQVDSSAWLEALISGAIAALAFGGVAAVTPIDQSVGYRKTG